MSHGGNGCGKPCSSCVFIVFSNHFQPVIFPMPGPQRICPTPLFPGTNVTQKRDAHATCGSLDDLHCAWTRPVRPRRRTRRSHLKKGRHAEDDHAALRMTAQRATPARLTPSSTGKKGNTNDRPYGQLPREKDCARRALSRKYRTTHVHPWTCSGGIGLLTGSLPLTTIIGPPYTEAPTSSDPHTPTRTQAHPLHAARSERGDSRVLRLLHALDTGRAPRSQPHQQPVPLTPPANTHAHARVSRCHTTLLPTCALPPHHIPSTATWQTTTLPYHEGATRGISLDDTLPPSCPDHRYNGGLAPLSSCAACTASGGFLTTC